MTAMRDENVLQNVLDNEGYFQQKLDELIVRYDILKEWRGMGYFYALEFMESRERGTELTDEDRAALQGGVLGGFVRETKLLIRPDDRGATMLVLSPPLVADRPVIDDIMERMREILDLTEKWMNGDR